MPGSPPLYAWEISYFRLCPVGYFICMKILLKPLLWIYFVYVLLLFLVFMFLVFPFVVVASFRGKIRGGNFIYNISRLWADVWFFLIGIIHRNGFESVPDEKKQYIFVGNHISYLDIPVFLKTVRRRAIRVLGKSETSKVPVFGFIYGNAVVKVDRTSADQRSKSVRQLKSVLKKGISIFIFPEGTFNMTKRTLKEFYDGAFRLAIETQTPILPVLFLDTYNRMHYNSVLSLNPGKSRSVFLEEISVEGYSSRDVATLRQKVYDLMEKKLIEYQADWIESH